MGQRNRQWKDGFLTQGEVQWIMDDGSPQVLLLGPLSNIYVLGSLHPQEGPLRVGLGGGRLPVERQEETALRDRQVGSAAVILGRYTPVL